MLWAAAIRASLPFGWAVERDEEPVAERYHSIGLTASGTDEHPASARTTRTDGPHDRFAAIFGFSRPLFDPAGGDPAAGIV